MDSVPASHSLHFSELIVYTSAWSSPIGIVRHVLMTSMPLWRHFSSYSWRTCPRPCVRTIRLRPACESHRRLVSKGTLRLMSICDGVELLHTPGWAAHVVCSSLLPSHATCACFNALPLSRLSSTVLRDHGSLNRHFWEAAARTDFSAPSPQQCTPCMMVPAHRYCIPN